ncbi:MAG: bacillithiol system redox-active protein YtxJ, partial [bacterium]|nr:bacillithiol system redox-active protein YtxJ [bacterium]
RKPLQYMRMNELTTVAEWTTLRSSSQKPFIIFKHSIACPISADALKRFHQGLSIFTAPAFLIIVQTAKDVSEAITRDLSVPHESPQVVIVSDQQAAYTASHEAIQSEEILKHTR